MVGHLALSLQPSATRQTAEWRVPSHEFAHVARCCLRRRWPTDKNPQRRDCTQSRSLSASSCGPKLELAAGGWPWSITQDPRHGERAASNSAAAERLGPLAGISGAVRVPACAAPPDGRTLSAGARLPRRSPRAASGPRPDPGAAADPGAAQPLTGLTGRLGPGPSPGRSRPNRGALPPRRLGPLR